MILITSFDFIDSFIPLGSEKELELDVSNTHNMVELILYDYLYYETTYCFIALLY